MVNAMDIPQGFKLTEVGIIPNDWDFDSVENLADITTGAKNTQDRIPDGDYPFFVRSQTVERISSYSFDGEAVLTAGDGVGTGKVFHYIKGKFDFHQRVYKISNFSERLDGYFFHFYFSNNFHNRIMQMTAKSSVDSVRREMIANMLVPVPSKAEQTAIATALHDADALIRSLERLIVKKRQIKHGAMQELLKPKAGWEMKRLGEIGDVDQDNLGMDTSPIYTFHYITLEDVDHGTLKNTTEMMFCEAPSRARRKIRKGDILISTVRPNLKSHLLIKENVSDWICSTGFSVLRCNNKIAHYEYVFHHLFASFINNQIETLISGSNYPAINSKDVRSLLIPFPKLEEQACIAHILSDMDAEIEALERRLAKLRRIKQGMMQNLLTGRIRLV